MAGAHHHMGAAATLGVGDVQRTVIIAVGLTGHGYSSVRHIGLVRNVRSGDNAHRLRQTPG